MSNLLFSNVPESEPLTPRYESEVGLNGKKQKILKVYGTAIVTDKVGINGRLYPYDIIAREAEKYQKTRIMAGRSGAELNHPRVDSEGNGVDGSIFEINLKKVCALIEDVHMNSRNMDIKFRVTRSMSGGLTTCGDILGNLIDHGMKPGCSLRGAGSATMHRDGYQVISEDYNMITVDIVGNPSFDTDAMLDVTYEAASKGTILMESINGDAQLESVQRATKEFLNSLDLSTMWKNRREARADLLTAYLETITKI